MPTFRNDDLLLHYDDVGQGAPVLLLQGVGITRHAWAPQVRALSAAYRCIAVDHRGIGGSEGSLDGLTVDRMARDALLLVESLGFPRVHVVGHSLGGVVAARFALIAPERTASLALLCTFAGGRDLSRPSARLIWLGLRSRVGTRAMRRAAFARLVSPESLIAERGLEVVATELEEAFGRPLSSPPSVSDQQLAALRAHDERERLGELSGIPTLVASGALDPIAEPRFGKALASAIGSATYREWAEHSHALPIQNADEVNDALRAHFAHA